MDKKPALSAGAELTSLEKDAVGSVEQGWLSEHTGYTEKQAD